MTLDQYIYYRGNKGLPIIEGTSIDDLDIPDMDISKKAEMKASREIGRLKRKYDPTNLLYSGISEEKDEFDKILDEMQSIHIAKNKDYKGSADGTADKFGITAYAIRLGDKYNRFVNLIDNENQVKDESIEDTLIDMANYAVMALAWFRKNKK